MSTTTTVASTPTKSALPTGFQCFCGHHNTFDAYLYAHWDIGLTGKCEGCDRGVRVLRGVASPRGQRRSDPSATFPPTF